MTDPTPTKKLPREADRQPARDESRTSIARRMLGWAHSALFDNGRLKFVAFVLALTVFVLVKSDKKTTAAVYVSVRYELPKDRELVSERVDRVRLTVRGPRRRIRRFDPDDVTPPVIDLTGIKASEYVFQEELFDVPPGLELLSISPATMRLEFQDVASKSVPVTVATRGQPARGYAVDRMVVEPAQVEVRGAQSVIAAISTVRTQELSIHDRRTTLRERVPLVPPEKYAQIVDLRPVSVRITFAEEDDTRTIRGVPVVVRTPQGGVADKSFVLTPATVTVVMRGAMLILEQEPNVVAYVQLQANGTFVGSGGKATVLLEGVKGGIATEVTPRQIAVKPAP